MNKTGVIMGNVVQGKFPEARLVMMEMLISELLRLHGADTLHALAIRMEIRMEKRAGNKALQEAWTPWQTYLIQRMGAYAGDEPPPDFESVDIQIGEMPSPRRK
jgi:hypothetical protein